jgi:phospholipid transport system substrate-binding protein
MQGIDGAVPYTPITTTGTAAAPGVAAPSAGRRWGAGLLRGLGLLMLLCWGPGAGADDTEGRLADVDPRSQSAEDVLRLTTTRILNLIEEARDYVDDDPERYYAAVQEVLDPVVDYRGFARGVMGQYATSERYRSLDEAGRDKLREQLERFSDTMRRGLVRTYSKGLLAFGGSRVEIDDSSAGEVNDERATLRQLIHSDTGRPYVVVYQMARDRDGQWLMRNLIVENVNLGQIYRSQFEAAARRLDGDIDAVIDNWDVDTLDEA